ncbi:hypothetical protein O988_06338 [Pseudogymnoascus sp. VKM F-3808]|nr:hypothetical protein O988_06338 [Pseudogymnoascus sp. VKM F-3808]
MKFSSTSLTLLFLPLLSLASPVAVTPKDVSETPEDALFTRKVEYCQIVNVSSTVNCRAGPGTGYASKGSIPNGVSFHFSCYKRGECVNGNCTWDYAVDYQCYINGYYTSSQCTIANLGPC